MCVLCPRFVSSLTVTLDQLSVNLSLSLNTSQSQVVQPNLAVQSAQIPAVDTQGVQFTALSGQCKEIQPDWSCLEPITLHDHINMLRNMKRPSPVYWSPCGCRRHVSPPRIFLKIEPL